MTRLVILGVMLATACGPDGREAARKPYDPGPPARSANTVLPADGNLPKWNAFNDQLVYGPPETAVIWLAMSCAAPGKKVEISAPTTVDTAGPLSLVANGVRQVYPSWIDSAGEDGLATRAEVALPDPVLSEFEATSAISLGDRPSMQATSEEERLAIKAFFETCRSGGAGGGRATG